MEPEGSDIQARIQRVKTLPTLPGVVKKLCAMVDDENTSAAEIGEIISTDQVLTAKVLKIVNSSFYGFPGRISTINHALVLLGFNVVKGIVLSAAIIDYMDDSLISLWQHSLGVAAASDKIARAVGADEPEEISTAGLLHDLGKVILSVEMPLEYRKVVAETARAEISFVEAEANVLGGLTHCQIAGWLAEEWNLPPRLREPITLHHKPTLAEFAPTATTVVHLANVIARALQFGSGGDPFVPPLDPGVFKVLNLRMADLAALLDLIDDEFEGLDTSDFT
ncbi:MAG TPA: HDOD domain-containing protein [Sumerlaeia bacterium]|nr:HDOD domain-containing protein [Sumerlaeia bacterium]